MTRYYTRDIAIGACNDAADISGETHSVLKLGAFDYVIAQGQADRAIYVALVSSRFPVMTASVARFHKVIFTSSHGSTAGLVVDASKLDVSDVSAISRLFPSSEARFMRSYHVSPAFESWDQAFSYVFPMDVFGNTR